MAPAERSAKANRLFSDTDPAIEHMLLERMRELSPQRKLQMMAELNTNMRALALAGLRSRHPYAGKAELRRRLAGLLLGEQLANRSAYIVTEEPTRYAYVASAEDTILAKLEWYQMGGEISERQWRHVVGIARLQANRLDWMYIERMAMGLGVADLAEHLQDGVSG